MIPATGQVCTEAGSIAESTVFPLCGTFFSTPWKICAEAWDATHCQVVSNGILIRLWVRRVMSEMAFTILTWLINLYNNQSL